MIIANLMIWGADYLLTFNTVFDSPNIRTYSPILKKETDELTRLLHIENCKFVLVESDVYNGLCSRGVIYIDVGRFTEGGKKQKRYQTYCHELSHFLGHLTHDEAHEKMTKKILEVAKAKGIKID